MIADLEHEGIGAGLEFDIGAAGRGTVDPAFDIVVYTPVNLCFLGLGRSCQQ